MAVFHGESCRTDSCGWGLLCSEGFGALGSVCGWAQQVIVLDNFSTDRTVEIAKAHGCEVHQHPFEDYAKQRNHALALPIRNEWVLFFDADEWLPEELKREIGEVIIGNPPENGFYIKRRFVWMGRWIRRGYYPTWILRLFRHGKRRWLRAELLGEFKRVSGTVAVHYAPPPICGAERTSEHQELFEEDREEVFCSTADELCDKLRFYLRTDDARRRIAEAGRKRCLASYHWSHVLSPSY